MLGQLAGQEQTNGRLNFSARDRRFLVVVRQAARFDGNSLENVVDERVHDAHRFRADSRVGMDLLEDFVDVDGEGFLAMATTLLVRRCDLVRFAAGFLFAFLACYAFRGSHFNRYWSFLTRYRPVCRSKSYLHVR